MKSLFRKKQPSLIGLDIGTRHVKAVLLEQSDSGYQLTGVACEPIIKQAFQEREIKDYEAVSQTLKKIKMALKAKTKNVVVAVAGTSVINKVIQMEPDQEDHELEGQIELEADSLIPYPFEEVYLDFEEQGPSPTHPGKVDVLITAAHKELVESRLLLAREVNFDPKIVDIESFAIGNALGMVLDNPESSEAQCCINIGASLLQLCVWQDNQLIYNKEHVFGTNQLVDDISAIHMMEREDAERGLLSNNLPATWQEDALPVFAANLQQQINRALQMYMSAHHAEQPQELLLCGGGAAIQALVSVLSQDFLLPVKVLNPFAHMSINPKLDKELVDQLAPQLVVATGLASRSFVPWHI
ncbi:type IV pilus assembly protein PilM [Alteromonas sp. KUL49]|uniref:type IV pilus assembly protein PilM n=1 Tax=Alteromonas sp. KUL49 TaxID=2480798 RepID=UPI00102F0901|nr:type IV pilus assembly protein PilM [Alteromonas sp. KUL49]TAP42525.1 type IV pilus assembly protein PilM [Alteromonas sp. KUL49]